MSDWLKYAHRQFPLWLCGAAGNERPNQPTTTWAALTNHTSMRTSAVAGVTFQAGWYWLAVLFAMVPLRLWGVDVQITGLPEQLQPTQGMLAAGANRITGKYAIGMLPESLRGHPYVTIDRGEMDKPGAGYSFTVNTAVTVYLAIQERGKPTLPEGWEQTLYRLEYIVPLTTGGTRKHYDAIYKKAFPPGKVEIPPHDGTDGKYYGLPHLAIIEQIGQSVPTASVATNTHLPVLTPTPKAATATPSPKAANIGAPLRLPDAELKPGKLIEFKVPLTDKAWDAACHLPLVSGEQRLKSSERVATVKVSLAVPVGFTPDKTWPLLVASSTDHRPNSIMAGYFTKPGTENGWVVLSADATPIPSDDSNQWRWALVASALEYLQAQWPGLAKWPVACGGFSGGAKRSGFFGAIMMRSGYHVIGMWMGGCNHDMATPGLQTYRPGPDFKHVPIFLSSGKSDTVATPQHHKLVMNALKGSGFHKVHLESYDGGHKLHEPHATEGLNWFLQETKR